MPPVARNDTISAPAGTPVVRFGNPVPPAAALTLTGPASGAVGVASSDFTVGISPANGLVTGSVTVTPSAGAGGGSFSPASVTLTQTTRTATFRYTPASTGAKSISLSNNGGLANPTAVAYTANPPAATSLAMTGPNSGTVGTPTANFTVSLQPTGGAVASPVTVTPSDGGGGGSFSPASLTLTTGAPAANFTYTPGSAGPKTISVANNGGLINPSAIGLTAAEASSGGTSVSSLSVRETAGVSGTYPYSATVLPLKGQVPSGQSLVSPDDANLRAAILATHDDGSASVMVVAGLTSVTANQTKTIALQTGSPTGTALTAGHISTIVTSVSVAFGGTFGTAQITNFGSPERIWWASPQVICARYRVAPPTPGSTALEAVVDIHAYAGGRALVEVVVENGRVNSAAGAPGLPAAASYTAAVVSVNGSTVATVNGNGSPEGAHSPTRAWYASAWVGGTAPTIRVTQAVADLQKHPILFQIDRPATFAMSAYATDQYLPWSTGRQRATNMGGGGDHPSIGPLPQWEAHALQSGDHRAWQATEVSALACLGYNVNYRDTSTGLVPTFSQVAGKGMSNGTWPRYSPPSTNMGWENAHCPAVGLMAFISRPSPVYIELAQKAALWQATDTTDPDGGPQQPTGVFGPGYQIRGQAWGIRQLSHATFVTPDALAWKAAARQAIRNNLTFADGFRTSPLAKLNTIWANRPAGYVTSYPDSPAFALAGWQFHYYMMSWHRTAAAGLLTGADQTAITTYADWLCLQPVRWVNEQPNGGWRYVPYVNVIGRVTDPDPTSSNPYVATFTSYDDWGLQRASYMTDQPTSVAGPWRSAQSDETITAYEAGSNFVVDNGGGGSYPAYFWHALCCAVERGVPGSARAWAIVNQQVTNLASWRAAQAADPRYGVAPRQVAESFGVIGTAVQPIAAGAWADISAVTNVGTVSDTTGPGGAGIAWTDSDSAANKSMLNWPGKATYDWPRRRLVVHGASNGYSEQVPAGTNTAVMMMSLVTGQFTKRWNPVNANVGHIYDANASQPAPMGSMRGRVSRRAYKDGVRYLHELSNDSFTNGGVVPVGGAGTDAPSYDIHPNWGPEGSEVWVGFGGRVSRRDIATGAITTPFASTASMGTRETICGYHPSIDCIVYGGGTGGTGALWKIDRNGTRTLITSSLPAGVPGLGPPGAEVDNVLLPDPQRRAFAWLIDSRSGSTRKVWRLDLNSGAWTDAGAVPAGFVDPNLVCITGAPIYELGVLLIVEGRIGATSTTSPSRVWAYRPA